jgi:copper chaperone CopZ
MTTTTTSLLFKKRRKTRTGSNENINNLFSSHHKKKKNDLNSTNNNNNNNNNNSMMMVTSLGVRGGGSTNDDEAKEDEEENNVMIRNNDQNDGNYNEDKTVTFNSNSKSYYLIWSPGFMKQFLIAMTIILTTIRCCSFYNISKWGGWGANFNIVTISTPFISNIILPLLSSSCCAIQLTINALSSIFLAGTGCVGFNSTLGPIRPYLLAITMIVYNYTNPFFRSLSSSSPPVLSLLLLRYTIVFMPELVYWWNSILRSRWKRQKNTTTTTNGNTNKKQDTENSSTDKLLRATLVFDVPTMGCVACVNKIESSLRQSTVLKDYIASTDSWLVKNAKDGDNNNGSKSGGFAKIDICVESEKELDDVINNVVIAIEGAGFRGTTIKSKSMMNDDDHKASN